MDIRENHINILSELLENEQERKIRIDKQDYISSKIDIIEMFKSYHKFELYNKKIENNKMIYAEKEIYDFIEKYIFNYYEDCNIATAKNIRKDKKYFLKYIKEQIILKSGKNQKSIENCLNFEDKSKSKYIQSALNNLEEYAQDSDYYTRKYREFIAYKKNEQFKLLTICPDIMYFIVMYNYPLNTDEKNFIDERFLHIIKDQTALKESKYLFEDLLEFYDRVDDIAELNEHNNLFDVGYSIFEQIFRGYRTKLILSKMNRGNRELDTKVKLTLSLVLQMRDIELSEKYINRILNKSSNLERTFKQALIYNLVYAIIDGIIEIMIKDHYINCKGYYNSSNIYI